MNLNQNNRKVAYPKTRPIPRLIALFLLRDQTPVGLALKN